jgi:carbon-monoxide dehydrogenase small subunit
VVSCLVPVAQAEDTEITTIEGLEERHRLQNAFIKHGAAQCGICTPGMIMAAMQLPPNATLEQIKTALAGNICRCTGYEAIYRAIQDA